MYTVTSGTVWLLAMLCARLADAQHLSRHPERRSSCTDGHSHRLRSSIRCALQSSHLARRSWPRPQKGCCVDRCRQPGFDRQWHTSLVRRRQLHLPSHDRFALNRWSRDHTDHDKSHVCVQRASGHVLDEISVSGCNAEGATPPFCVQAMVTPCLSAL